MVDLFRVKACVDLKTWVLCWILQPQSRGAAVKFIVDMSI